MPQVSKKALAQFIRSGCVRQLALNLFPDNARFAAERTARNMPQPQSPRPGLRQVQAAGEDWQAEKLDDLSRTFGLGAIVAGTPTTTPQGQLRYPATQLARLLPSAAPVQFIVEGEFSPVPNGGNGALERALGLQVVRAQHQLDFGSLRPDIVVVLPPGAYDRAISPDGSIVALSPLDARLQLRVIDIKMTSEASPGYFAEVVFYSMALAAWLEDSNLAGNYVVVPNAAIWPGSHDASRLRVTFNEAYAQGLQPSTAQLWNAMQEDLEAVPFEVFAFRVRRFFQHDVGVALTTPWQSLEWHVDSRCSFCEYLGEDRGPNALPPVAPHPDHCLPTAWRLDHVSRVAFVSQGARISLNQGGISQVQQLATRQPSDAVFDRHQTLRASRTVVSQRAVALQTNQVSIPPAAGTSASMPGWTDLRIYLTVDFDIGSAITVAFGLKAFWLEPHAFNSLITTQRRSNTWNASATIVPRRDLADERRELLAFLRRIHDILDWCRTQDANNLALPALAGLSPNKKNAYRTKVQFFLWDSLQFEHLARVVGRHLQDILAAQDISYLAWLFPPEDLLQNPDMATRRSAITLVREAVRTLIAAPVPHYYSLLEVARVYHEQGLPPGAANFNVHPHFEAALSDQIPSERAHEIWAQVTAPTHWGTRMATYTETVQKRLRALETVQKRLETDLRGQLVQAAPVIDVGPPTTQTKVSSDGQLWYAFARLNAAMDEMEVNQIHAMPSHERAAKFKSARLPARLRGPAEAAALAGMNLTPGLGLRVYEMAPDSRDVKAKVGDFAFALAPESDQAFLSRKIPAALRTPGGSALDAQLQQQLGNRYWHATMDELTGVTIAGIDRNNGLIALRESGRMPNILDDVTAAGFNLNSDVVLDPISTDFFTSKLLDALQAIGNPQVARNNGHAGARRATGQTGRGARASSHTTAADFIWQPNAMGQVNLGLSLNPVQSVVAGRLAAQGRSLNPSQWAAWDAVLNHRARLIWGPPGTGKSLTLRAAILGAVLLAQGQGQARRILFCASTYTAIDNVLADVAADIDALLPGLVKLARIRSKYQLPPGPIAPLVDMEVDARRPSVVLSALVTSLIGGTQSALLGGTPEQIHNLLVVAQGQGLFDLLVIDEASQMDVAHAILPLRSLVAGGSVVLAGDHLQLPPIHRAEPPVGLESMVGSIYRYWRDLGVPECPLDINYRSNDAIVSFVREAGYRQTLQSHSPALALALTCAIPATSPLTWPATLYFTPEWAAILDPARPAVCFVYEDGQSSQRNEFEADAVVALLTLLSTSASSGLANERDPMGNLIPTNSAPVQPLVFWSRTVGVVTPHRAQQALIVSRLQQTFGATGPLVEAIRGAVDTVERFQGQQRDVIVASYTLGDPDQIAEEEEFLMSLNRFNVVASRARAKLIVLVSQDVVNHLAHDTAILHESRLLKVFAESFCGSSRPMTLGFVDGAGLRLRPGTFRWR